MQRPAGPVIDILLRAPVTDMLLLVGGASPGVSLELLQAVEEAAGKVLPIDQLSGAVSEPLPPPALAYEAAHYPRAGAWQLPIV